MSKGIPALIIIAALSLQACAGGTLGTGVRKYSSPGELEEQERKGLFDFSSRAARCSIKHEGDRISMRLTPIAGDIDAELVDPLTCRATVIPLAHSLTLLVARNGEPLTGASFALQSSPSLKNVIWSEEYVNECGKDPSDGRFSTATIATRNLSVQKYYRVVVTDNVHRDPLVFEFNIGDR
jgi:hypothetical protein